MAAAQAFLDLAEQAPKGALYLPGVQLVQAVLAQTDVVVADGSHNSDLLAARDRLRQRLEALVASL